MLAGDVDGGPGQGSLGQGTNVGPRQVLKHQSLH